MWAIARLFAVLVALLAGLVAAPAAAQEDDKGYLTRLLEDNLSGGERSVVISGFQGALSSRATISELTISDSAGVWLTLRGVEISWNRAALLRRAVEIETLHADEILLPRAPVPDPNALASPEATGFSLPVLPVSVRIGSLTADRVDIGAAVFGEAAVVSLTGAMSLAGGEGAASLAIVRVDGSVGTLTLNGGYTNASRLLVLALKVEEAADGIAANLIGLPGAPELALSIDGNGVIDDFTARVRLTTDGQERLGGQVVLTSVAQSGDEAAFQQFRAGFTGDIAPLFAPAYREFFGPEITLTATGRRQADGRMDLSEFDLQAQAIHLAGQLGISPDGLPDRFDLTGEILAEDGAPVLLPLPGERTEIAQATLALAFDAAQSDDWRGSVSLTGLQRPDVAAETLTMTGTGRISRTELGTGNSISAETVFAATGVVPSDPGAAQALGREISGRTGLNWESGSPLQVTVLELAGADYSLNASGQIDGLSSGLLVDLSTILQLRDMTRFSGLAGRPLSGSMTGTLLGSFGLLSGQFDLTGDLTGQDLTLDQAEADRLLAGESRIGVAVQRDDSGITIRDLSVDAATLTARASGVLRSDGSEVTADLDFSDLAVLGPQYAGSVRAEARLTGGADAQFLTLSTNGEGIRTGQNELDRMLQGTSTVQLAANRAAGVVTIERFALQAATLTASGSGKIAKGASDLVGTLEFADLAVMGTAYGGKMRADVRLTEVGPRQSLTLDAASNGLRTGQPQLDLLLQGDSDLKLSLTREADLVTIDSLDLQAATLKATASGTLQDGVSDVAAVLDFSDLGVLGEPFGGTLRADVKVTATAGQQSLVMDATGVGLRLGQPQADRLLQGSSSIQLAAVRQGGLVTITSLDLQAATLKATASGTLQDGVGAVTGMLDFSDLSVLGAPYGGSVRADVRLTATADRQNITLDATGNGLTTGAAQLDGLLRGASTVQLTAVRDRDRITVDAFGLQAGSLSATGTATLQSGANRIGADLSLTDLSALGPRFRGSVTGRAEYSEAGSARRLVLNATGGNLAVGQTQVDRLLGGTTTVSLDATQEQDVIRITRLEASNPQLNVSATGSQSGPTTELDLTARLADLALLAEGFPGPATLGGTLRDTGSRYAVDLTGQGPGGLTARVNGTTARDFGSADLSITGGADAAVINGFIDPRSVQGPVRFDLALNGAPVLSSLSGTVSGDGLQVATRIPGLSLDNTSFTAALSGGQAQVSVRSGVTGTPGRITLNGPVGLTAPYVAAFDLALADMVLRDPDLYDIRFSGALGVDGPLAGGALISGRIDVQQAELRVPSTGVGGTFTIPVIVHVNEPAAVRATRGRAGLLGTGSGQTGSTGGPSYGLDLAISAPARIFVRGRGLDAELGGQLQLSGTTANVVPIGAFTLIRGRLDILGKRFTLAEGSAELQGRFKPVIRLVASTESDGTVSSIVIEGTPEDPQISFTSVPELPQEEVLARLLFGRDLTSISPFQAAQLASAVATLSGRGGDGLISKLRKGFALDDLDITTGTDGSVDVRVGKYLSENLYTDVTVGSDGKSEVSLNLDLSPSVTLRGAVQSDGNTGIGIFFEKDY